MTKADEWNDVQAKLDSGDADALRVVSFRCDGNEDSEAAFDRVWRTLADKTRGPAKCAK